MEKCKYCGAEEDRSHGSLNYYAISYKCGHSIVGEQFKEGFTETSKCEKTAKAHKGISIKEK